MLKKLFLSHYHEDASEVSELAIALCLRGVVPWVDKDGGFSVADHSEREARRAIREDCFGACLYATPAVFTRPFIRDVEMDEAVKARGADPSYLLFAIPRGIGFGELAEMSETHFGVNLANFHTFPVTSTEALTSTSDRIATGILDKALRRAHEDPTCQNLSLQFSTRERMPDAPKDVLRIDATTLFKEGTHDTERWARLLIALRDIKHHVADTWGRPRLFVHGSKHLSAAFLFGRVFAPYTFDIRQTPDSVWSTDASPGTRDPFEVHVVNDEIEGGVLYVEIASRVKDIGAGVNTLIESGAIPPGVRLSLRPTEALDVDNALCVAMARQAYREIERLTVTKKVSAIHIFAAAPQSFLMMLGRLFQGMPEVLVYEWSNGSYSPACRVPPGVL